MHMILMRLFLRSRPQPTRTAQPCQSSSSGTPPLAAAGTRASLKSLATSHELMFLTVISASMHLGPFSALTSSAHALLANIAVMLATPLTNSRRRVAHQMIKLEMAYEGTELCNDTAWLCNQDSPVLA